MIDDLYSAKVLSLTANIPRLGRLAAPQGSSEKVAKLCGSRIVVDVVLDAEGRVADFAQDVKACALGQAAASVLGAHVLGAGVDEIATARDQLAAMLKSGGPAPTGRFEDLAVLAPVKDYPARYASTLLAFEAAVEAARIAGQNSGRELAAPTRLDRARWRADKRRDSFTHPRVGMNLYERSVTLAHRAYKLTLSPLIGRQCRFLPTCSDYAREALIVHGPFVGGWLTTKRLCSCHPWGGSGYDPVPPRKCEPTS